MKIADIMTPSIVVVDAESDIMEAAEKMKDLDVGFLAVIQDRDIHGLVTDRDIVIRGLVSDDFHSLKIRDIMTENPVVVKQDSEIDEAALLFAKHQIRRLIVVDDENAPVGVVSLGDLAVELEDTELIGEVLKHVKRGISAHDEIPEKEMTLEPEEVHHSVTQ